MVVLCFCGGVLVVVFVLCSTESYHCRNVLWGRLVANSCREVLQGHVVRKCCGEVCGEVLCGKFLYSVKKCFGVGEECCGEVL